MGFSQEDESEKPEAAWENPVLVIVRGIKYNESYKMLTGGICMGSYLNPGNEAFAVALNSEIYVDKTGLLTYTNKVMNTLQGYICNSRPRRFGKSFAANMLAAYYSKGCDSRKMFSGLAISQTADFEKHLNQYDVIHLDIQWFLSNVSDPEQIVAYITECTLAELRTIYADQLPPEVSTVPDALSRIKEATGQKFVIIIDEWDVLIRDASADTKIQDSYINFLRGLFKGTLPTRYIALAYLTGILPIKKVQTQSALNNFNEFTMLDARGFAKYIGFTEEEVKTLCDQYHRDFEKVKRWYDGYLLENCQVYNPKAVVEVLRWNKYQSYWSRTGTYDAIVPLINMDFDGLKTAVITMLSGSSVEVDVSCFQNDMINFSSKDDVLTYLIHLGYLGYDQNTQSAFIPNEELRQELTAATRRKRWDEMMAFQAASDQLLDATLDLDTETVADEIEKIHSSYTSVITYHDENSLSSVLTIAYLSSMKYYFKPIRELPTGRGFADFVYLPKPEFRSDYPALLVELKWNHSAHTALNQIKEKKYIASLEPYIGDILLVGINYDKKTKKHECLIEKA